MKLLEKSNNLRKSKKGFTLVELIVVIVILAILAAILIPTFVNYMNKAQDSQKHVQARSVYLAANTVATEKSYMGFGDTTVTITKAEVKTAADDKTKKIKELVGVEVYDDDTFEYTITFTIAEKKVTNITVEYTLADGKTKRTIPGGTETTTPTTPAE